MVVLHTLLYDFNRTSQHLSYVVGLKKRCKVNKMELKLESLDYTPLFELMREKKITAYQMQHKWGIPNKTLYNIKKGKVITIETLVKLAYILDTDIAHLVNYKLTEIDSE